MYPLNPRLVLVLHKINKLSENDLKKSLIATIPNILQIFDLLEPEVGVQPTLNLAMPAT